jgi:hypothetical protein
MRLSTRRLIPARQPGNVDADFVHGGDGLATNNARLRASGVDLELVTSFVAQKTFGHLASG